MDADKAFIAYWDDAPMPELGETQARDIAETAFMAGRQSTAAPELLTALEACANALSRYAHTDDSADDAAETARAAIAKATQ